MTVDCPHWAPGSITVRAGCTACSAERRSIQCEWPPRTEMCSESNFENCGNHHHHHVVNGVCVIPYKENTMTEPTEFHSNVNDQLVKAESRAEVLGLALGAASACWEDLNHAGLFDSSQAGLIMTDAENRLRELDKPLLGLATTAELVMELSARYTTFQYAINQSFLDFLNYRTVDPS